ncbi:hypothetical protein RB598_009477 [Gaeumannomyces tritici]
MNETGAPVPVTEWPDYGTNPRGGDPITQDLNAPYDKGDLCWLLVCIILCWQITPAIGFLYAGMHRSKAALTMSRTDGPFIGDLSLAGLHNVLAAPSLANPDVPDILYACFGFTFVTATAMILAGAMLERGRLWPSMVFLLCWTTFVYYILAFWEWNPNGWLFKFGVMDFAGSGPVTSRRASARRPAASSPSWASARASSAASSASRPPRATCPCMWRRSWARCFYTNKYKYLLSVDEGLDIFAIHGMGGFVGDVLTGVFAVKFVGVQLAAATSCATWAFAVSCALLFVINKIPGLHIRAAEDDEIRGLDYKYLHDVDDHSGFDGLHMLHEGVPLSRSSGSPRRESAEPVTKQVSAEPKRD